MKSILIAAFLLSAIFSRGQDSTKTSIRKDSLAYAARIISSTDWGTGFYSSGPDSHSLGTHWSKRGWEIQDTMGLINRLKTDLDRAYKELYRAERLHQLSRSALMKVPFHDTKEQWDTFNKAVHKYLKEFKTPTE